MAMQFDDIIFGPIHSRRLGLSLGVNLLPTDNKLCNFECIYCECGWTKSGFKPHFHSRDEVALKLAKKLSEMEIKPDVITFAGNGEPTMHPDFEAIIDDTIAIRNRLAPESKISVLSNATLIDRESVRRALLKVDNNILKLDSAFDDTVKIIDNPRGNYSVAKTVEMMKLFKGKLIVQTMFLRGECNGQRVDNTTDIEVEAWLRTIEDIAPKSVMVYSIDRQTPLDTLEKVSKEELDSIAQRVRALGVECSVA